MTTKYVAFDASGKRHTRTPQAAASRSYTHCVVVHLPERPDNFRKGEVWPAYDKTEWAGTLTLAQNNARRWERSRPDCTTEIVPAEIAGSK